MRPVVTRAQKLAPGAPKIFCPETAWGLSIMHYILGFISWTKVVTLLFKFVGPPANAVPVDDYGFRQLEEWSD